ncbi:(d)CMP kinase, partial [Bacillus sp. D-CC]
STSSIDKEVVSNSNASSAFFRAERRHLENMNKGFDSNLEQLKEEIAQRDKLDSEREVSPLKKADDALELDTTSLSIEEVVQKIMGIVSGVFAK